MAIERDVMRLALETGGSTRTIRRWMNGEKVSALAAYALALASKKLKIKRRATRRRKLKVKK